MDGLWTVGLESMKVISFAATKGGTGKTTLCYNVAMHVAKKHQVLLADLDPQRSLKDLWERRSEMINPRLISNIANMAQSLQLLKEAGLEREYLFVDTPGSFIQAVRDIVACSHLIVLPVQPGHLDLIAQEDLAAVIAEMGMDDRAMFVINRVEASSSLTKKAQSHLARFSSNPIMEVGNRVAYMRASATGKAGCEINKTVAKEIEQLWDAMKAVMAAKPQRVGDHHEQRLH